VLVAVAAVLAVLAVAVAVVVAREDDADEDADGELKALRTTFWTPAQLIPLIRLSNFRCSN
jgi:hypothetical protein